MNTYLKRALILIAVLISINTQAQFFVEKTKYVNFHIRGGMNISNVSAWKNDYGFKSGKAKVGYNVGGIADIMLGNDVYLQTGLIVTSKGTKVKNLPTTEGLISATMDAVYLQLPIYFMYKFNFPNGNHVGFSTGPYVAYGIAGNTTMTSIGGVESETKVNTFSKDGLWNRPDVGIAVEIQMELKRMIFTIGSDTGLARIWKKEHLSNNMSVRNNNVYFNVGLKL